MSNQEMLELAAKAAGVVGSSYYAGDEWSPESICWTDENDCNQHWNPLTDDGAALRLLVRLRLSIDHNDPADNVLWVAVCDEIYLTLAVEEFDDETGRQEASRHAIVRAAAEIGRNMP